ncbi:MAG: COG1361 S-layer family protein [Candidatus Aenigmatarchaeota archaeon]
MKLFNIAGFALMLALMFPTGAVFATEYNFAAISVTPLRYEPLPVQPGKYFKIWITVENIGTDATENLIVQLDPKYPFSFDSSENGTRAIGTLNGKDSTVIDCRLRVAEDAVEGINELKVRYSKDGGYSWTEKSIRIDVQTLDVNLDLLSVDSREVFPGGIAPLEIVLKNEGDSSLTDVSVSIDISALPFYPINTTTEKKIYLIRAGETKAVGFSLMASPTADCQPYKVPLAITFKTLDGTEYTKADYLTVVVCAKPEIVVDLESTDILSGNSKGTVTVNIVNKGLTDVKFLTISLKESDKYEIISAPDIYIGKLDSDDFDTADFDIFAKVGQNDTGIPLKFGITFLDGNNNGHAQEKNVHLRVYTTEELKKYNLVPASSNTSMIIFVLVVAVVAYWLYSKRKKKK